MQIEYRDPKVRPGTESTGQSQESTVTRGFVFQSKQNIPRN